MNINPQTQTPLSSYPSLTRDDLIVYLGAGIGASISALREVYPGNTILAVDIFEAKAGTKFRVNKSQIVDLLESQLTVFHGMKTGAIPIRASALALAAGFQDRSIGLTIIDLGDNITNQAAYNLWLPKSKNLIMEE